MKKYRIIVSLILLSSFIGVNAKAMPVMDIPEVILTGVPFEINVTEFDQGRVCDYRLAIDQRIYEPAECNESLLQSDTDNKHEPFSATSATHPHSVVLFGTISVDVFHIFHPNKTDNCSAWFDLAST